MILSVVRELLLPVMLTGESEERDRLFLTLTAQPCHS